METYRVTFCLSTGDNIAPISKSFSSEASMKEWAHGFAAAMPGCVGFTFREAVNADTRAVVKRHIKGARYGLLSGQITVNVAVAQVSRMCEALPTSPFELDGFAAALAHAFKTPNAVNEFCNALMVVDGEWFIDLRRVQIKTNGGMTLIAPAWSIRTYAGLERLAAYWDMRLGLTRNEGYFLTVKGADVSEVHYV